MLTKCLRVLVALLLLEGAAQAQNVQTGTLSAANGFVRLGLRGEPGVGFAVNGTWSGTITFQCSADGARYDAMNVALPSSSTSATTTTSNGTFQGTSTGCLVVQAVMTAYTSGTATIAIVSAAGPAPVSISSSSSGNAAASSTGAAVPSSADYQGLNISGNLVGATGLSLGTARAAQVAIVDGSGNQITSFGGGTQYATGSAQATPTGTAALGWDGTSVRVLKTDTSGNLLLGAFQATPTVNAAQSGNWTARLVGNTGAVLDFAGQNASSPANAVLLGGQFNTSPTTITTGNASPLQLDSAARLLVDCAVGCGGSGGTSAADNLAFTQGTTAETPIAGLASTNDAAYTSATTGHNTIWQLTTKGHGVVNAWLFDSAGTGVTVGQTTMSASLPVALASNQSTLPVSLASLPSLAAGSALIGEDAPVATADTTNSLLTCYLTSAATTNSTNCKASAGNVYAVHVTNTTATNYYVRMYNLSTAPTCSSSTGFVETIPALGATANGAVNGRTHAIPQSYGTGIGFCLTGGGSSTDNTNAATGVYLTIEYK